MAIINFTYKVTFNIPDEEIEKLTKFLTFITNDMKGTAQLIKTSTDKSAE